MPRWRAGRWRSRRRLPVEASSHPRPCGGHFLLIARDLVLLDHRQADVVEAVEQAMLAERIDLELHLAAVRPADFLVLEIDRERRIRAALRILEQLLQILGRDL